MIVSTPHASLFLKDVPILRIPGVEKRTPILANYVSGAIIETKGWDLLVNPWGVGVGIGTRVAGHGGLVIRCRVDGARTLGGGPCGVVGDQERCAFLGDTWVEVVRSFRGGPRGGVMDLEQRAVLGDARGGGVFQTRLWEDPGGLGRVSARLGVLERGLRGGVE
jgi:hypothetical protein